MSKQNKTIRLIFLWGMLLIACAIPTQIMPTTPPIPPPPTLTPSLDILSAPIYSIPETAGSAQSNAPLPLIATPNVSPPFLGIQTSADIEVAENLGATQFQLHGQPALEWLVIAIPDSDLDPIIELYDKENNLLATADNTGTAVVESLFFTPAPSQIYTLHFTPFLGSHGKATIALFDPARLIPLLDVTEQVAVGETKRHQFEVPPNTPVFIEVIPDGTFDPVFEVYTTSQFIRNIDANSQGDSERWVGLYQNNTAEYSVTVFGFQGDSGRYRLIITPLSCC